MYCAAWLVERSTWRRGLFQAQSTDALWASLELQVILGLGSTGSRESGVPVSRTLVALARSTSVDDGEDGQLSDIEKNMVALTIHTSTVNISRQCDGG